MAAEPDYNDFPARSTDSGSLCSNQHRRSPPHHNTQSCDGADRCVSRGGGVRTTRCRLRHATEPTAELRCSSTVETNCRLEEGGAGGNKFIPKLYKGLSRKYIKDIYTTNMSQRTNPFRVTTLHRQGGNAVVTHCQS